MVSTIPKPLMAQSVLLRKSARMRVRVIRQQQVFSALAPSLSKAEDRQASDRRELACLRNGYVVTALALALVFSALDVFRGQLYDFAVAA